MHYLKQFNEVEGILRHTSFGICLLVLNLIDFFSLGISEIHIDWIFNLVF